MKYKKTLLTTEIEFTPTELRDLYMIMPERGCYYGLMLWLKKEFGLDMISPIVKQKPRLGAT
jgi:hypothetical protein